MPDKITTHVRCIHINNNGNNEKLPYMALYFDTYTCPETNSHCKIKNPVPENTPAINAFLNVTFVFGMSINMAVKNNQVNRQDANSNKNEIIGDMNSRLNTSCSVEVINRDNPLAHIIKIGNIMSIAV